MTISQLAEALLVGSAEQYSDSTAEARSAAVDATKLPQGGVGAKVAVGAGLGPEVGSDVGATDIVGDAVVGIAVGEYVAGQHTVYRSHEYPETKYMVPLKVSDTYGT